jgi:hypothetical protein
MAVQATPPIDPFGESSSNLTVAAIKHLRTLTLPEPQGSALNYALTIAEHPDRDKFFCAAGKVVHVTARFKQEIYAPVTLRGTGPLSWDKDFPADHNLKLFSRTFTFHVPVANMDDTIEFKTVIPALNPEDKIRWQSGDNTRVDLSTFGHIVMLKLNDVSFE